MKLCIVSSKECWQDETGRWVTGGGFPLQMAALGSLFDEMTLVILAGKRQKGGSPLPPHACVVPLRKPPIGSLRRKVSVVTQMPYYLNIIRREIARADVVHTPVPGDIGLMGLWIALAAGKRVILRYNSSWAYTPQMTFMNGVTKHFARRYAGGRNVMLATGMGDTPPAPNMHWIFSTAISEQEIGEVRPHLNRGLSNPPRMAFMGRLAPEKGLDNLIKAVAMLKKENFSPLPVVELIGEGPLRQPLEKLARELGVSDEFIFVGQLNRPMMMEYLNNVDICVLPSLTESFMKARLDAMLCGLPVITTEVGFGRELVGTDGERGWLVQSGDPVSLAKTIRDVLTSPLNWPALRQRCRSFAEHFTLELWADEIGQICSKQWGCRLHGGKLTV